MAFGDSDLVVFFGVTGVPVVFGAQSTRGNLDEAGVGGDLLGIDVQDSTHIVEIALGSLNPMPNAGASVIVDGRSFTVRLRRPVDDGKIIRLWLKAVR